MKDYSISADEVRRHQAYTQACLKYPSVQDVFKALHEVKGDPKYPLRTFITFTYAPEAERRKHGTLPDRWGEFRVTARTLEVFGFKVMARYGDAKSDGLSWFPWEHLDTTEGRLSGVSNPLSYKVEW